jgi:cobalt-zinc-cadmium efflux system outer membrane protein
MRVAGIALTLGCALTVHPTLVSAQTPLTLTEVLARARTMAPDVVSARLALEEARGRLVGASVRNTQNPELGVTVGNRQGEVTRWTDFEIDASQWLEPPARRKARIAAATAGLEQQTALVDVTTRQALRDAAVTFHEALYATERLQLLTSAEQLATAILDAADRRYRAGEIAVLDVNLARAALARARADREAGEAARVAAAGSLAVLLRLTGPVAVDGNLRLAATTEPTVVGDTLRDRPELAALEAAVREAEADVTLGEALKSPNYGLGVKYMRDAGDNVVMGGLNLSLPVFSSGQELRAIGTARSARLRTDLEIARARLQIELQTATAAYERRRSAVRILEQEALPGLDENETLATRSFEAGQIGLPELLLVRREILDTRFQYLSALLEAAIGRVVVGAISGALR